MILYLLYLQLFFFYGIILGLTGPTTCVRIVHDLTQPQREAKNLGDIFFFFDSCIKSIPTKECKSRL